MWNWMNKLTKHDEILSKWMVDGPIGWIITLLSLSSLFYFNIKKKERQSLYI